MASTFYHHILSISMQVSQDRKSLAASHQLRNNEDTCLADSHRSENRDQISCELFVVVYYLVFSSSAPA